MKVVHSDFLGKISYLMLCHSSKVLPGSREAFDYATKIEKDSPQRAQRSQRYKDRK